MSDKMREALVGLLMMAENGFLEENDPLADENWQDNMISAIKRARAALSTPDTYRVPDETTPDDWRAN